METTNRDSLREETAGELRALLARRRVSASELGRRLGWKQSYTARRIDGRVALDLDDLQAIAAALEISVLDLLPGSAREVAKAPAPEPTPWYGGLTERPTPAKHRPPNMQPRQTTGPGGHQPGDHGPRRTARVQRTART